MNRGLRTLAFGLLLASGSLGLRAHDETPRPVAELQITSQADRLTVAAHLPIAALADVNLPRVDGRIDRSNLEQPLQIVAGSLAASLEMEQNGTPLPAPTQTALLTDDDGFVDVRLGYVIRQGVPNLSARLRTLRARGETVAVVVRFEGAGNASRTFTVAEGSERVTFDPDTTTATTQFVGRGARMLLDNWDVVLFVICLVVPTYSVQHRRRSVMLLLVGELITASLIATGWVVLQPTLLHAVMAVAASALVVVSLQAVVSPGARWQAPLSLLFGLANGVAIGHYFRDAASFAGSHPGPAFITFIVVVMLVRLWVVLLLSSAAALFYRWGVPERIAVLGTSVVVCHTALDLLGERSTLLTEVSGISSEHFLTALAIGWAVAVLAAGRTTGPTAASGAVGPGAGAVANPASARP